MHALVSVIVFDRVFLCICLHVSLRGLPIPVAQMTQRHLSPRHLLLRQRMHQEVEGKGGSRFFCDTNLNHDPPKPLMHMAKNRLPPPPLSPALPLTRG